MPIGSGTGDEHLRAFADARLAQRGDADRQRLAQRGGVIGNGVGYRVGEVRADRHVIAEGAVDRRGAEEPHVRAQVVVAAAGLRSLGVGPLGFDGHPLTDARGVRPTHRRRRSSPPLRGRAPTVPRRRSCRSGRGGNSACRIHRPRPTTPGSTHHPVPVSARDAAPSRFDLVRRARRPAFGLRAKVLCTSQSPC